jgi:glutamine synthetase
LIGREVIREIGRRHGLQASFTPKPAADAVGNGAHVHLSLIDDDGTNQTYDPDGLMNLSKVARQFSAGILAHLEALVAITAPTPISYFRLGPHHWSCGFKAIGLQNREAALRVTPGIGDEEKKRKSHNLEYRPCDGIASPYLVLGALVRAGLEGIRSGNEEMTEITEDPAEMSDEARLTAGVTPLPASLDIALAALNDDAVARGWFPPQMHNIYQTLKNWEVDQAKELPDGELFERYKMTY